MQPTYCYTFDSNSSNGTTLRTVEPDYVAKEGEFLKKGEPASRDELESVFPGSKIRDISVSATSAVTFACLLVNRQIEQTQTYISGYSNAASIVMANGGNAPSIDPLKTSFAELATVNGLSSDDFAKLVGAFISTSLKILSILDKSKKAINSAKEVSDITRAITDFEIDLDALITNINAANPLGNISNPPSISVEGAT